MTTTLLAVDDSKTMRKVLEITFAGEDYRTVLAPNSADALEKVKAENPKIALVDARLGAENGYDLCQSIKGAAPGVAVIILSSKQQPYDRARGTSAGADDFMDKPFDTQQMIDKVATVLRKAAEAPAAARPAPAVAPAPAAPPAPAAAPHPQPQPAARPAAPARTPTAAFGTPAAPSPSPARPAQKPAPAAARPPVQSAPMRPRAPTPVAGTPAQPGPAAAPAPAARPAAPPEAAPPAAAAVAAASGELADKLQGLGLTQDQVQGVLALSREVIEQVVWEVVPVLAETMIQEEIRRLTSE